MQPHRATYSLVAFNRFAHASFKGCVQQGSGELEDRPDLGSLSEFDKSLKVLSRLNSVLKIGSRQMLLPCQAQREMVEKPFILFMTCPCAVNNSKYLESWWRVLVLSITLNLLNPSDVLCAVNDSNLMNPSDVS
ncbi:hypothetical protein RRG08_061233 [Elysia crispata]|uniref:Uncharacterized protein n=1 Tax=Elysia crispata TaxID=231223 RepID=A0AAE0ZG28_9GAST|nr:hypothetical protein RRG08_061233 [Elysia crispata]